MKRFSETKVITVNRTTEPAVNGKKILRIEGVVMTFSILGHRFPWLSSPNFSNTVKNHLAAEICYFRAS